MKLEGDLYFYSGMIKDGMPEGFGVVHTENYFMLFSNFSKGVVADYVVMYGEGYEY